MKPSFDLSVYLVTDPVLTGGRSVIDCVAQALKGGVTMVQLRDPQATSRALVEQARALKALLPSTVPLIINDRVDVALACGAAGVHLGQDDMDARDARALLGPDAIIGLSVGDEAQWRASQEAIEAVDYLGVGPVFSTTTKSDSGSAIGAEGVALVRALTDLPIVAIGGLRAGRIAPSIAAGAQGAAVVSAIMNAADPAAAVREIAAEVRGA